MGSWGTNHDRRFDRGPGPNHLMDGMIPKARHAVCLVALMLAQLRFKAISDAILKRVETKLDTMMGKVAEKQVAVSKDAANVVGLVLEKFVEEIRSAARGMNDNTARLTKAATKCSDVLQRAAPLPSQANTHGSSHLPPCLQAREGVKAGRCILTSSRTRGLPHLELNCWSPSRQGWTRC